MRHIDINIDIISLILFFIFIVSYLLKLFILSKQNRIKAYVLGKSCKDPSLHRVELLVRITSFFGILIWFMESVFSSFLAKFTGWFFLSKEYTFAGIFLMALGVTFFILAAGFMKTSWRVGIDKDTKTKLVTDGIYKYSRNPAFVGFDLMFIGLCLIYPCVLTLIVMVSNLVAFHLLILQEEKHLTEAFGDEYIKYKQNTPRYFLVDLDG